jgi:hypothetical protein
MIDNARIKVKYVLETLDFSIFSAINETINIPKKIGEAIEVNNTPKYLS